MACYSVRVVAHEAAKQAVLWEVGGVRDREGTEARSEGVATRVATVTVAEAEVRGTGLLQPLRMWHCTSQGPDRQAEPSHRAASRSLDLWQTL